MDTINIQRKKTRRKFESLVVPSFYSGAEKRTLVETSVMRVVDILQNISSSDFSSSIIKI